MADLSTVLEVLRQRHEADLQAWGCAALRNLTEEGGADFRQKALEHGALELVLYALERHAAVAQVQECGLAALSGFAKGESHDSAAGSKGLRLALKAVKEHSGHEEVCRWALSAVSELLRCEKMAEELGKYSFLDLISFAMQRHPHAAQVQACGMALLGRFCLKSDASRVAAVDKAARGLVFNAMEAHPGAVEVQACGSSALGAFVLRGGHQRSMAQSRAPELLLEAMRQHGSDATVQEKAANALRLVVGSEDTNVALQLGAAEVLVSALRLHSAASRVLSACLAALHSLTAEKTPPTAAAFGFAVLAPKTPRECDAELLMQILRRYPDNSSILDPALALLWGTLEEDTINDAATAVHLAAGALDAAAPRTVTLAAAVLSHAALGAAPSAVPGKVGKQLLRVIKLHPQNRMLQERAWEALLTVLRLTGAHSTTTLDMASMLRNLVETMKRHPGPVQRIGCDIMTVCCLEQHVETSRTWRQQLLELEAPQVIADAMQKNLEVVELQDSACASLQCLAMEASAEAPAAAAALCGTEEALLLALEAQPNSQDVQIRALDLLSAAANGRASTTRRAVLLPAVPLALRALRSYGQESPGLAEVSVRLLLRMLDDDAEEGPEPMEGIARRVLDFLDELEPSLATRTVLRCLARQSHDVCTRILALNGVPPAAEADAPPLLTLQLLTQLALCRAARAALRSCAALKRKALEALGPKEPDQPGSAESRDALAACSCCLWSRLADSCAAAQQLTLGSAEGSEVPLSVLELLLQQLQVSADPSLHAWCFLTLQNLLCGSSHGARERQQQLLQRGLLRLVAAAARGAQGAQGTAATQRLETILMICLHSLGSCCDPNDQDLLSEEVLSMLIRGLGTGWALEVRERACFLLCYLANSNEKVKDTLLAGGAALWKSLLEVLKDHLAEVDENDSEDEEILLELFLPDADADASTDGVAPGTAAPLRAMQLREAELLLEAMQALPFEARVQVTACSSLRRLALLAMSASSSAQCLALVQRLPRAMANAVQAMKQHERSDEVQRAAVLALQALTRLCSSLEGDVAIQRVVDLETVPILARALRNYPEDPQMQERGLDVLRLLSTRRDAVTEQLCGDGSFVPAIVEAMNLNISKPKIQEYGLSLLAEVGWQGAEQQCVVLSKLGVEAVVRALKAFPHSGDVQTVGLAAVQAITSDNEECRVKFFSLCEILEIVLQAMGNFPLLEGVQAFGCAALISLVHSKSERIGALADLNGASMAESAMVGHPKSQRVLEFAEHLMEIMRKG